MSDNGRPGKRVTIDNRDYEIIDRSEKAWWALDIESRAYVQVKKVKEKWQIYVEGKGK